MLSNPKASRGPFGPRLVLAAGHAFDVPALRQLLLYFLRWDRALPAADFDAAEVRPSRRTFDAAVAARAEVRSLLVRLCVRALPAAVRELFPVFFEASTFAAAAAALGPVDFVIFRVLELRATTLRRRRC